VHGHSRVRCVIDGTDWKVRSPFLIGIFLAACFVRAEQVPSAPLVPPSQEEGLPYTRSALPRAVEILRGGIAVYPGSRYAMVNGLRVRLSPDNLLRAEAIADGQDLLVPAAFVRVLKMTGFPAVKVPDDLAALADRWVFTVDEVAPDTSLEASDLEGSIEVAGEKWIPIRAIAERLGKTVAVLPGGLMFIGVSPPEWPGRTSPLRESIVTLFDTPEKFANPDIATRHIPMLTRQGKWTDHVKVTSAQIEVLEGPETEWPSVPTSQYQTNGIDRKLFGSKVPPPGVYPRLLFSPEDIPFFSERVKSRAMGRMSLIEMEHLFAASWWDPRTSDGRILEKLSSGQLDGLEWDVPAGKPLTEVPHVFKGQKPGITNSHVAYVPECLTSMALYAILMQDDALGTKVASAVANYYKLREPLIDEWLNISDSEFGSGLRGADGSITPLAGCGARTHWRNIHGIVAQMNLGLSLDLAGKWMSGEQKDTMRRVIAKATYGRRSHGQDGPVRFRDVNWMAWDLPHFLAVAAIEGLEGFDPEAYASGAESVRAFCDWGVDPDGVVYESNGKTGGGFQFQLLSMVVVARRGGDLFAHPHWRRLLEGQVQMTSPNGRVVVNSGTQYLPYSRQRISLGLAAQLKSFYPGSRLPDYLVTAALDDPHVDPETARLFPRSGFDEGDYRAQVSEMKRLRLPGITYPGFVRAVLYDGDVIPTTRADLGLPLDFSAPVHGVFSAYSDRSKDAVWMNLMVRPDHYLGAGHHHADSGMFHFSALGVDWFTESPFTQVYNGNVHNLVMVDGKSEADGIEGIVPNVVNGYNAPGVYLGATIGELASAASADLTYAYSWRWNTQPPQVWGVDISALPWEMDPSPAIARIFAGTVRYKLRPWWPNYNCSNYIATSRAPFNPMESVFRTTGIVRGKHPYGFVIDDLRKDGESHLFQWGAMLNGGVWQAKVPGLPANAIALGTTGRDPDILSNAPKAVIEPSKGDAILLVYSVGSSTAEDGGALRPTVETVEGPRSKKGEPQFFDRLIIAKRTVDARFRVLLLPMRFGEPLPEVSTKPDGSVVVEWKGQRDEWRWRSEQSRRTLATVLRDGEPLLTMKDGSP